MSLRSIEFVGDWSGTEVNDATFQAARSFSSFLRSMRQKRVLVPNAQYHVVARANRGEFIFRSPKIKELFLNVVRRAKKRYTFSIENFCIMSNHVHLMIRPGQGESLSRIMQWILSVFALRFNRIFGYTGHVWYDRFKSRVIESYLQWISTFLYVMQNPVRARLVEDPFYYPYCGVAHMRAGKYSVIDRPVSLIRLLVPGISGNSS